MPDYSNERVQRAALSFSRNMGGNRVSNTLSNANSVKWPNKTFYVGMLLLVILDVVRGQFPAQPLSFVIGYLLWPRLERVKSTFWSRFALFLCIAALLAISIAIGIMLKPFGEKASDAVGDGLSGLIFGLGLRGLFNKHNKTMADIEKSIHSP